MKSNLEVEMIDYGNLSGKSGVIAFRINDNSIDVQFRGGNTYRYAAAAIGAQKLSTMSELALAGEGLATFIAQDRAVHAAGQRI